MNAKQTLVLDLLRLKRPSPSIRVETSRLIDTLNNTEKAQVLKIVEFEGLKSPNNLWFDYVNQVWIEA